MGFASGRLHPPFTDADMLTEVAQNQNQPSLEAGLEEIYDVRQY